MEVKTILYRKVTEKYFLLFNHFYLGAVVIVCFPIVIGGSSRHYWFPSSLSLVTIIVSGTSRHRRFIFIVDCCRYPRFLLLLLGAIVGISCHCWFTSSSLTVAIIVGSRHCHWLALSSLVPAVIVNWHHWHYLTSSLLVVVKIIGSYHHCWFQW